MASSALATTALLITFNLLFFTMVTSTYVPCPPPPSKVHHPPPSHPKSPPSPHAKSPPSPLPKSPPSPRSKSPPSPHPKSPPSPAKVPCPPPPPQPKSPPSPVPKSPPTPAKATCPRDTLKLGVCGNLLNDLVHIVIGTPTSTECCGLIGGLTDLDAAVCLCTAIKANLLGINLNVPVSLSVLLSYCDKKVPSGFQCT
ncbi:unnamed protein product [Rhodiola kirilowii]